jgi:hypothetical protein
MKGEWHLVAFFSKKLDPAELNYQTHDQELLAIVKSFEKWRHYFEGSQYPIEVLMDHNNLRYFMETTALTRRQARWAQALSAYDFHISYRAGKTNPADGPSRRPDYEVEKGSQNVMLPTLKNKLREAMQAGGILQISRTVIGLEGFQTEDLNLQRRKINASGVRLGDDHSKDTKSPIHSPCSSKRSGTNVVGQLTLPRSSTNCIIQLAAYSYYRFRPFPSTAPLLSLHFDT